MKRFAIHTLGCKTNQLESATIKDSLIQAGYELVKYSEIADFYIVNTCSVTAKSDSESAYYVRKAKNTNPEAKIVVTGCSAQLNPHDIGADIVVGNANKLDILDYIKNNTSYVSDIMQEVEFKDKKTYSIEGKTRANVKIQDGCNSRCAYCIIPYARGRSRSNTVGNIVEQIEILTQKGFKEVVLTGIHIGQWGLDFADDLQLINLLEAIEALPTLERYRLGSLQPPELADDLIEFLIKSKKFSHHLHISMQNANNETLKLMNRKYTVEYAADIMAKLKSNIPDISLGCDIIAGFPTETDEQFNDCYLNLEKLPLDYMHVFPYSIRPGTPAADMEQVDENTKKDRAKKLQQLARLKKEQFITSMIGKEIEVLVELKRDKSGMLKGISSNYINVLIDGDYKLKNKMIKAQIISFEKGIAIAKVVGAEL